MKRIAFYIIIFAIILIPLNFCYSALLKSSVSENIMQRGTNLGTAAGFSTSQSPGKIAAVVISGFLSLLGVIFLILILLGGYNWMTAAGDEQKVAKAKDILRRAVIGLIIIIASYSITHFVFKSLDTVMAN